MSHPLIDLHAHVASADTRRYPRSSIDGSSPAAWADGNRSSFESLSHEMDSAGVDKAALVQAGSVYADDNSYILDCLEGSPDRFVGVVGVDLRASRLRARLTSWFRHRGIVGIRLFMLGDGPAIDESEATPVWEFAAETGTPVSVLTRWDGLPTVRRVLDRHPSAPFVLDHVALPPLGDGPVFASLDPLLRLSDYSNLVLKVTTLNLLRATVGTATPQGFVRRLARHFGADRLVWGSNFPANAGGLDRHVSLASSACGALDAKDAAHVLGGTALRLYPGLAGEAPHGGRASRRATVLRVDW